MTAGTTTSAQDPIFPVPERLLANKPAPYVASLEQYKALWEESVNDPENFFGNVSYWGFIFIFISSYKHWDSSTLSIFIYVACS